MPRLMLVSGGSGSGKSAFAESLVMKYAAGRKIYAATMHVWGAEGEAKVERHRQLRAGKGFITAEQPTDIGAIDVKEGDCVLVECLSNLLANEMYDEGGSHDSCVETITAGIFSLWERGCDVVCVSCEVFSDGQKYDESTMEYIKNLGKINGIIAKKADFVAELVCGIPIIHKDAL